MELRSKSMGIFNAVVVELELTNEMLKDKDIQKFAIDYLNRKVSNKWIQYKNGNAFIEINKEDGTSIRTILSDEEYKPEFPENIDMTISNKCYNRCKYCYMGCSAFGKEANIKKFIEDKNSFLYTLHEGTELALNGNEPLHPDLQLLLEFCKDRNIFANLTVHENTLLKHKEQLQNWLDSGLIHGIGISPRFYGDELIDFCEKNPTAVIHTIAGITTLEQYESLAYKNLKILILGYKDFGRGESYKNMNNDEIHQNMKDLEENIIDFKNMFKIVSFDNLALEQLNIKNKLTEDEWNTFFRGNDGNHTMYIDLVNETFAKNSVQPIENHKKLLTDVRDMLKIIRE